MTNAMLFSEFCNFCEKISTSPKKLKPQLLNQFIRNCRNRERENSSFSVYSVLRLLVPSIDRARGAYGLKEALLAKLLIRILCLPKESSDAARLITYRTPKSSQTAIKDFADVAYYVLKRRTNSQDSSLTVEDINNKLDELAHSETVRKAAQTAELLQPLLIKLSAKEQKWLIRIILKDARLAGLTDKTVLKAYHPDAKEKFEVCNNLETVIRELLDESSRASSLQIELFQSFLPMLADRVPLSKIMSKMGGKPFYVETKLDGERTQLHKDGERYRYFSRRGFDYTSNYGGDPSSGNITPRLHNCFDSGVKSCILDGEMVAWNVKGSFLVSKANVDVKSITPNGRLTTCFFPFDILMLNGDIFSDLPLSERLKILEAVVKPCKGVLQFPHRKLVSTKKEVIDLLNDAIDKREEGIVLKDPESTYKPNERKKGWIKVKPEYVNEMMDHLDLIILGGYYGQGRLRDVLSAFLMGVAVPSSNNQPPKEFFSLSRVGSGFSDEELATLLQKLNPHWKKWDKKAPPSMIHCCRETPDLWIEPTKSVILEVKASEIVESDAYKAGLTLRFPRVERIREDRSWDSAMTLTELREITAMCGGKLVSRHWKTSDDEPASKRKKSSIGPSIATPFLPADLSNVTRSSSCFAGNQFCVLNGGLSSSKHDLERQIVACGGTIVQNPDKETFCAIAGTDDLKVKGLKKKRQWNVVHPSWVLRCVEAGRVLPFRPEELFVITEATTSEIEKNYDKFGNPLFEPTTVEQIPIILKRVKEQVNPSPLNRLEMADLEYDFLNKIPTWGIFRLCVIYIDLWEEVSNPKTKLISTELEIIGFDLRMHGAELVNVVDDRMTHVLCESQNQERIELWKEINHRREKKFHIVGVDWVMDSITRGQTVDEQAFYPISDITRTY